MSELRNVIKHTVCSDETEIDDYLAQQLADDPGMLARLVCAPCGTSFPIGEFVWPEDGNAVHIPLKKQTHGLLNHFHPAE